MKKAIPGPTFPILLTALVLALTVLAPAAVLAEDGQAATSGCGQKGSFNLIYGDTLCKGQWAFSLYYNKWDRRVQSDPVTLAIDPLWTDWDMDVERASIAIGYGLSDRAELSLMLPYWSFDGESIDGPNRSSGILNGRLFNEGRIDQSGLGNVRAGVKFLLAREESYNVALMPFVDLPTGDDDESVVTGDTGFGLRLGYDNTKGWIFNLGYFSPGDSDFGDVSDEVQVGFGYVKDYGKTEWITELGGILYTDSNGEHDAADITSGGRWHLANPDWAFNAALRVDLSDLNFDYTPIGGLVGVSFAPKNRYSLTVATEGSGNGTITSDDGSIDCGTTCTSKLRCDSIVTLTAKPEPKSRFEAWGGDCAGSDPTITLTLTDDMSCTATFIQQYDVEVEVVNKKHADGDQPGQGKLAMLAPAGAGDCSNGCKMTFDVGTGIELKATPEPTSDGPSTFDGWSVDCSGSGDTTSFSLDRDKTCVATFIGPPRPCDTEITKLEVEKCAVYANEAEWSCDSATWTQVVSGFAKGGIDVPANYLPTDENEKKTPLCDVVNFLRLCPQVKTCVAGAEVDGEPHCTAEKRAARVASFLAAQAAHSPFADVKSDRIAFEQGACSDQPDAGQTVEIFFQK
ncbi:MAG: hypothetical protein AAGE94_05980 [Acidobacteriota bacterium]